MAATDFIVAIELGSSKITSIAGRKNDDGSIHVLACAKEDSSSFIRKGVIYNIDKTAQSLVSIKKKLESALKSSIGKVYVGINGQSLRTVKNTVVRHLDEETIITQELVDAINDENVQIPLIDLDILDVAPQEYKIGINLQADPVGVLSNHIEGRFLNIIARNSVKKNLQKCFEQAGIEVVDYFISPLALADVILTDNEKRSGCALIDFGADTTTVSVYKNNLLRHLAVIPLGGNNITRDICSLKMEEEDAEMLKVKHGDAMYQQQDEEDKLYSLDDKRAIDAKTLNDIIEARADEIIANTWNQIQLSGYEDQLLAGIIITGGGANLQNMEESIQKKTKIDKVKAAKFIRQGVKTADPGLVSKDGTQNTILGLLYAGKENCCMIVEIKPEEEKLATTRKLFEDDEDIKKKEAEKRKQEEEEKKRKKEEEKRRKEEEKRNRPNKLKSMFEKFTNDIFSDDEMK